MDNVRFVRRAFAPTLRPSMTSKRRQPISSHQPARAARGILAQWRGVDLTEQENAQTPTARPAAGVIPGLVKKLRLEQRRSEAEIAKVWNELIDPAVTEHAQPTGLHKGTLFVNVDSNVWLSEIVRYRRQEILQRLQHAFGKELVARISFRVG